MRDPVGHARRAWLALLIGVVVAGAGCTASTLAPASPVHLSGAVADAAGRPLAGAQLVLFKEGDFLETVGGLTVAIATLGAACFLPGGPPVCADAHKATSRTDGSFSFDLTGQDTQGSVGNADNFDLTAFLPAPGGGARNATTARFRIQRTTLAVPTLRPWGAPVEEAVSTAGVRLIWTPLPGGYGPSPSYTIQFFDGAGPRVVATQPAPAPGAVIDTRWLEDRPAQAEVDATTREPGPGTDFVLTYRSQSAPVHGNGPPPSRGAPCFAAMGDQPPVRVNPCLLTDGDFYTPAGVAGDAVYLDLGRPEAVGLVVVRGGSSFLAIEGSADAKAWAPLGNAMGGFSPVTVAPAATARYVRARSTSGISLGNLTEISVWP